MKKILITASALFMGCVVFAQTSTAIDANEAANLERIRQNQEKNKAAEASLKKLQMGITANKANTNGKNDGVQSEKSVQPQRNLNVQGSSVEPEVIPEAAVVKNAEPKPVAKETVAQPSPFPKGEVASKPAPEVQVNLKGTSMDPDAKPVPAATSSKPKNEGGDGPTPTPVESKIVKAPVKDAAAPAPGNAPVPPKETEKPVSGNTNNSKSN